MAKSIPQGKKHIIFFLGPTISLLFNRYLTRIGVVPLNKVAYSRVISFYKTETINKAQNKLYSRIDN